MTELTGVLILATVVEAVVEYLAAPPLKRYAAPPYIIKYVAAGVGILLCVTYSVDILNMLASLVPIHPMLGYVLSGIIVGRGSNFLNDIVGLVRGDGGHDPSYRFRKPAKAGGPPDVQPGGGGLAALSSIFDVQE